MLVAWHILAWVLIVLAFAPLSPLRCWWVRVWDFPRLQVALLCAALLVAYLFVASAAGVWSWLTFVVLFAAMTYELYWVHPYVRLMRVQVSDADERERTSPRRVRLLIANVMEDNRRAEMLLAHMKEHEPDIILAVETDFWWAEKLDSESDERGHQVRLPNDNGYGMMLYSRLPLRDVTVRGLSQEDAPSVRATVELADGATLTFYGLHPPPPLPPYANTSTQRDAELVMVGREIESLDGPVIVAGDLNDVAWSHTSRLFQRLSGLRDPRVGRGLYNSFHAKYFFARWPLDHVFVSEEFRLVSLQRLASIGSDHFPILVEVMLSDERGRDSDASAPDRADAADQNDANETLAQHREEG